MVAQDDCSHDSEETNNSAKERSDSTIQIPPLTPTGLVNQISPKAGVTYYT